MGDPRHDNYYGTGKPASGETTKTPNPLWGDIASMIPVVGPMIGNQISRWQQQGDIAKQNAYNSPLEQLARLREAGLPMAAMGGPGGAGNQSALPGTSGQGIGEGLRNIGQWAATQAQLKGIKLLDEEIRLKASEADVNEATRDWILSGKGIDTAGTNLTSNLQSEQAYKAAQAAGQTIANQIQSGEYQNQAFRLDAENKQIIAGTEKILRDKALIDEKIESEDINQKIQNVLAKYQTNMSSAQLSKLLKENGLISEHITGARLDNTMKTLENYFRGATLGNEIMISNIDVGLKQIMSDEALSNFKKTKGYNDMVNKARGLWDDPTLNASQRGDALGALIYTSIASQGGGSSMGGPGLIIGGIGAGGAGRGVKKYQPKKTN